MTDIDEDFDSVLDVTPSPPPPFPSSPRVSSGDLNFEFRLFVGTTQNKDGGVIDQIKKTSEYENPNQINNYLKKYRIDDDEAIYASSDNLMSRERFRKYNAYTDEMKVYIKSCETGCGAARSTKQKKKCWCVKHLPDGSTSQSNDLSRKRTHAMMAQGGINLSQTTLPIVPNLAGVNMPPMNPHQRQELVSRVLRQLGGYPQVQTSFSVLVPSVPLLPAAMYQANLSAFPRPTIPGAVGVMNPSLVQAAVSTVSTTSSAQSTTETDTKKTSGPPATKKRKKSRWGS